MRRTQTRVLSPVTAAVVVALMGACGSSSRVSEEEVRDVARDADGPVFYVGTTFAGLPLTHIEKYPEGHSVETSFLYGDCEPPAGDGGCPLPLEIQSTVCSDGSTKVGIFGSPALRQRAARSLRPAGGGDAPTPDVAIDRGPSCGF